MSDVIGAAALLIGAFFMLVASLGLVRLPDVYTRMHAATKATTFGMGGILLTTSLAFQDMEVTTQSVLALVFLFLTAPVSAHLISRAAYKNGPDLCSSTTIDEYGPYLKEIDAGGADDSNEKSNTEISETGDSGTEASGASPEIQ